MTYQTGDYEAVHQSPAWRGQADFIFSTHIGIRDGRNEWEQMWGKKVAPTRFMVCCIPFFAKDIALGDVVETDSLFTFQKVVKRSGHITFRVWFESTDLELRRSTLRAVVAMEPIFEWSSENFCALSICGDLQSQNLANLLQTYEDQKIVSYDTGRSS